jgi:ABC-type nitrate/sulfonate/bicarbonate transport system substrate-binding protein
LSDLDERIQWADDNPEKVQEIIENMTKMAPNRQDAVNQVKKLIGLNING